MLLKSKLVKSATSYRTIIFYNKINVKKLKLLQKLNVKTFRISLNKDNNLNLKEVLFKAKKIGFNRIFLETGLKLTENFLKEDLIDDFILFMSDKKLKKNGRGSFKKYFNRFVKNKSCHKEKVNLFGESITSYKIK